jgi:hypothetical protein
MRKAVSIVSIVISAVVCVAPAARADGVTACQRIVFPCYSVDVDSPITDPNQPFLPGDVLIAPGPSVLTPAAFFGLSGGLDELDGLSLLNTAVDPTATFLLLFSVDRASAGIAPPDPALVAAGLPFNVQQQAINGQAAGDAFAGVQLYNRNGVAPSPSPRPERAMLNNVLMINQGDASGIDYALDPNISPADPYGGPENNVDAGAGAGPPPVGPGPLPLSRPVLAFSVGRDSPALLTLPGTMSGADVYLASDPNDPNQPGFGQVLYAAPFQLNLVHDDDIDALILFDDGDLVFNPEEDQILFSLSRSSPSLGFLGLSAADMITTTPGGGLDVYANAFDLGLGPHPDPNDPNALIDDDVTMLDYLRCDNVNLCLLAYGIGTVCPPCPGDVNGDGLVNITDVGIVLAHFGQIGVPPEFGDVNHDGVVNIADLGIVLANYGATCT